MKRITNWIKRVWQDFTGWLIYEKNGILNSLYFDSKVRKANRYHKRTNKQYHVFPVGNKLIILNNEMIANYNKTAKKNNLPKIDIFYKSNIAYYSTPTSNRTAKKTKGLILNKAKA